MRDNYAARRDHQVTDESDPKSDLSGIRVLDDFGLDLANGEAWPNRYKGNEFRAVRAATLTRR